MKKRYGVLILAILGGAWLLRREGTNDKLESTPSDTRESTPDLADAAAKESPVAAWSKNKTSGESTTVIETPSSVDTPEVAIRPTPVTPPSLKKMPVGHIPFQATPHRGRDSCARWPGTWFIAGEGADDYEVTVKSTSFAKIHAKNYRSGQHVELNYCVPLGSAVGTWLTFAAWVKTEGVSDYANLHIRAYDEARQLVVNERKGFKDTFGWKLLTTQSHIPEGVTEVVVGVTFESPGTAWLSASAIEFEK